MESTIAIKNAHNGLYEQLDSLSYGLTQLASVDKGRKGKRFREENSVSSSHVEVMSMCFRALATQGMVPFAPSIRAELRDLFKGRDIDPSSLAGFLLNGTGLHSRTRHETDSTKKLRKEKRALLCVSITRVLLYYISELHSCYEVFCDPMSAVLGTQGTARVKTNGGQKRLAIWHSIRTFASVVRKTEQKYLQRHAVKHQTEVLSSTTSQLSISTSQGWQQIETLQVGLRYILPFLKHLPDFSTHFPQSFV